MKLDFKGEWLDNIIEVMLDVLCSDRTTIRVNQTNIPIEQVRKRYMQIDDMHIRYAVDPEAAWDKICSIEDVRGEAIRIIRDFV